MLTLVAVHVVGAVAVAVAASRLGRHVMLLGALAPAAAFGWLLLAVPDVLAGATPEERLVWAPPLGLELPLRLDGLALLFALLVAGVGALVLVYAAWYFSGRSEGLGRTAAGLVAFAGAMLGLVLTDHLLGLYVFWELTTVCSFVLIGDAGADRASRRAAVQALLTTTGGGLVMLLGLLLLGTAAGTWRLSEIVAAAPGAATAAAVTLVLVGAFAKSALVPFHPWLPAAMVAPTPVSAYLHAAAMVKAGVYLVGRLTPALAEAVPWTQLTIAVGLVTMLVGAWRALAETDLKLLLASSTVSQLGFLTVLLGAGTRTAALAGEVMLLAHALSKAALFLVVGIIDHEAGTRDLRALTGVGRRAPGLAVVAVLAGASLAGVPPLAGYLGKEAAVEAFVEHQPAGGLVLAGIAAGSALTVAYTLRFLWGAFADRPGVEPRMHRPPVAFTAPAAVLAAAGLAVGLLPHPTDLLARVYADTLTGEGAPYELALWHGVTPALGITALAFAAGVALHAAHAPVGRLRARLPSPPDTQQVHETLVRLVDAGAGELTARIQTGRLQRYLAVALLTVATVPGTALVTGAETPGPVRAWDNPVQALVGVALLVACAGVVVASHRLAAVLAVSAAGYLVAALFVIHGAPDLALTQLLVESITLVVFVFVLRRAPRRFPPASTAGRAGRAAVALAVGAFMTAVTLAVTARSVPSPVAAAYLERAPEAGGHNAVNAILVDFRALDTLGEITVLTVVATGVASLILVRRRTGGPGDDDESASLPQQPPAAPRPARGRDRMPGDAPDRPPRQPPAWNVPESRLLPAADRQDPADRSALLEVATRILHPTIVMVSMYLLLAGHDRPGGGFAAGLVAALGLVLRYLAGGPQELHVASPVDPGPLLGAGLAVAAGYAAAGVVAAGSPLAATTWTVPLGALGHLEVSSALIFDAGVFLIVVGLAVDVLRTLGAAVEGRAAGAEGEERP